MRNHVHLWYPMSRHSAFLPDLAPPNFHFFRSPQSPLIEGTLSSDEVPEQILFSFMSIRKDHGKSGE